MIGQNCLANCSQYWGLGVGGLGVGCGLGVGVGCGLGVDDGTGAGCGVSEGQAQPAINNSKSISRPRPFFIVSILYLLYVGKGRESILPSLLALN